jgi:hypothetical protein
VTEPQLDRRIPIAHFSWQMEFITLYGGGTPPNPGIVTYGFHPTWLALLNRTAVAFKNLDLDYCRW